MTLEWLITEWQKDANVDITEPGLELLKNPSLHAKYCEQLSRHSLALKHQRYSYAITKRFKSDYYNGRLTREQLEKAGLNQFQFILKSDISTYMDADADLQKIDKKIALHEEAVSFLSSVIKAINNRSFDLRGFIDYLKFTGGK